MSRQVVLTAFFSMDTETGQTHFLYTDQLGTVQPEDLTDHSVPLFKLDPASSSTPEEQLKQAICTVMLNEEVVEGD